MKRFKESLQKMGYVLLVEIVLMGALSFVLDHFLQQFTESWLWWHYVLGLAGLLFVTAFGCAIYIIIQRSKTKRRMKVMGQKVRNLQLQIMQNFFLLQMKAAFGGNWQQAVKQVVETRIATNDPHKSNYQGIYNVLRDEGVETLDEKDLDITGITALLLHDFYQHCRVGSNYYQQIKNIREDKNKLVSHIPDPNDLLNVSILELTALKDLRSFLTYLRNSGWQHPEKVSFTDKYLQEIEAVTGELFAGLATSEQAEVELKSTRLSYLKRLAGERAANLKEYMPLSYKASDSTRYDLTELDALLENKNGFVLFADAGYGKTWSITELAGLYAQAAQTDDTVGTPILIKMGQLARHEEPIVKAVQEILFPSEDNIEMARNFLQTQKTVLYIDGMDEAHPENKETVRRELLKLQDHCQQLRIIGGTRESDKQKFPDNLPKYSIFNLTDEQARDFIEKLITDEKLCQKALFDYFENPATAFLRHLRSPFYLKCFVDFTLEGESAPLSDTDMMSRCIDKMIQREICIKGFAATVPIINDFLLQLSTLLGENHFAPTSQLLKAIKDAVIYDTQAYASVVSIKDTLVELQILKETISERRPALLGFAHEKYKSLFSPLANDIDVWNYEGDWQ